MQESRTELEELRQTIKQLSDQMIRSRANEEKVLNEFSAMNNELVTLQRQLAKSNAEIGKARQAAEQANESKSSLLAMISHEIRTPMNGIIGMAEMMDQQELTDDQHASLKIIKDSGALLIGMINDLLDLSKLDAGKMELKNEPLNLHSLLNHIAKLMDGQIREHGNQLSVELEDGIHGILLGDPVRIRQIVLNLLGNANKFTRNGQLTIRVLLQDNCSTSQHLRFEVQDTGMGISAEDQKKLFKPYMQTKEGSAFHYGGTGLGLSISKSFVELMKGSIGVISDKGAGALFWFEVELDKAAEEVLERDDRNVLSNTEILFPSTPSASVLVAEDNPINRQVVVMQLKRWGLNDIDTAEDGEQAARMSAERSYSLILMDNRMPRLSGLEAAADIRRREAESLLRRVPIVAMTGNAEAHERESCLQAGMDDYLIKPVSLEALGEALKKWLSADTEPEVLDMAVVRDIMDIQEGEGPGLLPLLLDMFREEMPAKLARLERMIAEDDMAKSSAAAHDMKSGSLSLGMLRLSSLLQHIEDTAKEGQPEACREGWMKLVPVYEEACSEMERMLARLENRQN